MTATTAPVMEYGRWTRAERMRLSGIVGVIAAATAMTFLLLVAGLNAAVLATIRRLWRQLTRRPPGRARAGAAAAQPRGSLLMTRAYSWAFRNPARKLYYNIATTAMTVVVATLVGTVYLSGLLVDFVGAAGPLRPYAALGDHFEVLGYVIVAMFVGAWVLAALSWRIGGFERRYGGARS